MIQRPYGPEYGKNECPGVATDLILTQWPPPPIWPSVHYTGQVVRVASHSFVTTSGFANLLPLWPRRLFDANFLIIENISGHFGPFPALLKVLPVSEFYFCSTLHRFRVVAHGFLIGSISSCLYAIRRPYGPEYSERDARGQTGSRNMAATRFFDSPTATSYSAPYTLWGLSHTVMELPRRILTLRHVKAVEHRNFHIPIKETHFFVRNSSKILSISSIATLFKYWQSLFGPWHCWFVQKIPI